MTPLRLYWWSPRQDLRRLAPELVYNSVAWAHLARETRRAFLNFGDELSPHVLEAATGRRVVWSPAPQAEIAAIGSIYELVTKQPTRAAIWGCGIRGELSPEVASRMRADAGAVLAVRGPRTRSELSLGSNTVLGDPGLLSPLLVSRQAPARDKTIVIPHFSVWNSRLGRRSIATVRSLGFDVVAPSLNPLEVLQRIADARFVISSSLHGVIVAHSLGVPAQLLIKTATTNPEPLWKYEDYFESLGADVTHIGYETLGDRASLDSAFQEREAEAPAFQETARALGEGLQKAIRDYV